LFHKQGKINLPKALQKSIEKTKQERQKSKRWMEQNMKEQKYNTSYRFYERGVIKSDKLEEKKNYLTKLKEREENTIKNLNEKIDHYERIVCIYKELLKEKKSFFAQKEEEVKAYIDRAGKAIKEWDGRFGTNPIVKNK
jgi:hypothetical protein